MPVVLVETMDDFNNLMELSRSKLVVIDFSAQWCAPCRYIDPAFIKMADSGEFPDAVFAKCPVNDTSEGVAAHCQVHAMPTFLFYRRGKVVGEITGANEAGIRQILDDHKEVVNQLP